MKTPRYLVPNDYMADPAVHIFEGKLYIYPSHDRESGIPENDNGDHFDMNDYNVFSMEDIENGKVTDHGVILKVEDIAWAGRQLWDSDAAFRNGKYYLYFSLKDKNDVFHLGVAEHAYPSARSLRYIRRKSPDERCAEFFRTRWLVARRLHKRCRLGADRQTFL